MNTKNTTLCAIIDRENNRVLMVKKLRGMRGFSPASDGLDIGFYNLPGGKNMPGETFHDCALRECREETGITPIDMKLCGQLNFIFPDLLNYNQVFVTDKWAGEISCPVPDECETLWMPIDKIPYDNMWGDDRHWFPEMLRGEFFHYDVIMNGARDVEMIPREHRDVIHE